MVTNNISRSTFVCKKQSSGVFCKKGVLRNFAKIHRKIPVPQACNFIKKETQAQVFSCEFCKIFKNTFLYRTLLVAASGLPIMFDLKNDNSEVVVWGFFRKKLFRKISQNSQESTCVGICYKVASCRAAVV